MKKLLAVALIMLGIGLICAFFVFDKNDLTKIKGEPYTQEKTVDSDSIRSIHTETDTFNLEFVRGDSDEIQLRLEGNASKRFLDKIVLNAVPKGDTLYIESFHSNKFTIGWSMINLKLIVELPDREWDSVDIVSDTGNIVIDQLHANTVNLQSDIGNVKASNYEVQELSFESDTGNVTLLDGSGVLKGESDIGNIRIETNQLLNDVFLQSDTGNVTINVDKQPESAAIRIKKDIGSSKINWDGFEKDNDKKYTMSGKIGSGDIHIDINSEIGNIKLGTR
ncbi:DUF4097 domain-containing protein [Paenibacillus alkaliterrae]|uniref:DUF4097 family beta strand repeat-containing protein n=1 Tax=Paenibacillus alkaliterrae TaxID=320909 RepID=UPI001F279FB1|nr:DUF4097 family beta strand repeat-containing protein [Paenibacillus alkaliterrae]MCF2937847.1 DUF4097 domain-containing protein [Paenibacillus alkaliterrae]